MPAFQPVSPEEYLAMERASETKHELVNGEIYAMSGASLSHVRIAGNIFYSVRRALGGSGCSPYGSDLRVKVSSTGLYTYPDVTVVCGQPQLEDGAFDTLLNPSLIVEVLSPSTESYDRGAKWAHYRQVPSLQAYVLVSQHSVLVEHLLRAEGGEWRLTAYDQREQVLELPSLGIRVALSEIYEGVDVPSGPPSRNPSPSGN